MRIRPEPDRQVEQVLLLLALTLFLFASPLMLWWAADDSPWYVPYLLWLLVILCGAWVQYWRHRNEP